MLASCAFFFADLDRIEPRNAIAYGLRALRGATAERQPELEAEYAANLAAARSARTGRTGADILGGILATHAQDTDLIGAA